MSTPHNSARPDQIAPIVLMPGDPLRAKAIAEKYLKDPICFNSVRNMLGYTGTYKGQKNFRYGFRHGNAKYRHLFL